MREFVRIGILIVRKLKMNSFAQRSFWERNYNSFAKKKNSLWLTTESSDDWSIEL